MEVGGGGGAAGQKTKQGGVSGRSPPTALPDMFCTCVFSNDECILSRIFSLLILSAASPVGKHAWLRLSRGHIEIGDKRLASLDLLRPPQDKA